MFDWRPFLFGGLASSVAELATFPIDLTKTRLQIQGQIFDNHTQQLQYAQKKYTNMFQAIYRIGHEEGVRTLYSGVSAALLRQATYGTIKIGIYQKMKRLFADDIRQEKLYINVLNGMFSGALANAIANPTDLLKIRMQANHPSVQGKGLFTAMASIAKKEGVRGLWSGVLPTVQRAAIVSGIELAVYDCAKQQLICQLNSSDTIGTHFLASFIAGFAGAFTSTPIDVVRTRLMNQENSSSRVNSTAASMPYKGIMDCFVKTTRNEGFSALYKGFFPSWLRLGPWNIVFFIVFEQFKNLDRTLESRRAIPIDQHL
ncbi:unnamed protein product [Rotaria magnacalcarata]|uniref:Uncharacterized protein n=1 Tax=Rotaria magnacalcarata TaxID=392030 RepID=A0A814FAK8_9BILA|nr:unnamed protein product [Rotaria magnacalcarata]CAF1665962.1 unnamed protein product [Rotaria magnacalcarata]CAF2048307.1 unnamed protein product [Rotaria magnacalcarata]CAF2062836.1 unnamed protein product [Rotaria magnacalcarata]CAF2078946.1 unnamed protein product [Rotaria magnacalcarata]